MRPTTTSELIKKTAEELQLPEKMVGAVVHFFYKFVRKNLSQMKADQMTVTGLGTFKPRHWLYQRVINKCKSILYNVDPKKSLKHAKMVADTKDRLELIEATKIKIEKQMVKRNMFRAIQVDYDILVEKGENPRKKLEEDLRRLEEPEESERLHREHRCRTLKKMPRV